MKEILYKLINNIYSSKTHTIIDAKKISDLTDYDIYELNSFHAYDIDMLVLDDNYFCGIRANHFVIEFGWSENIPSQDNNQILITANHKGIRVQTLLNVPDNYLVIKE